MRDISGQTVVMLSRPIDGTQDIESHHIADDAVTADHIADASVTNAALANSSVTFGSTACALGGTATLVEGDIPSLNASKINSGTLSVSRIPTLSCHEMARFRPWTRRS